MVSQDAKNGLDVLMTSCLNEALKTASHSDWSIKPVETLQGSQQREFIMLTISSYAFRLFMLLHFTRNEKTSEYIASALKLPLEGLEQARYYDYLGEMGNTFVGALKRELGRYFPCLGMSTPNRLAHASLKFLEELPFDYDSHFKANDNSDVAFYGSLYVSAYKDLDFRVDKGTGIDADVETGALELF